MSCSPFLVEHGGADLSLYQHWSIWVVSACLELFELQRKNNPYPQTFAPSEDSDQPAYSRSLFRIFTKCVLDIQWCKVSPCGQWRLWSDCADAQDDLCLRWMHMSEGTFSHVETHFYSCITVVFLRYIMTYSRTSLSRTRLFRIPAYLEVKNLVPVLTWNYDNR